MEYLSIALTALCSFVVLFVIAKCIGHKQISQLDFFDYITGITIGSIAAEMATELENPWQPLLAMGVYGAVGWGLSVLSSKLPRMRKYINGTPTILMQNGKLYRKNFQKAKLDLSEFMVMCRQQGYFDLSAIQVAVYEFTGRLTILPVTEQRPVTPKDIGLAVQQEELFVELIMDGCVLEENLRRMGLDRIWLMRQLTQQGMHSPREVFLAVYDRSGRFVLYPKDAG